jgi:hypothetical protein
VQFQQTFYCSFSKCKMFRNNCPIPHSQFYLLKTMTTCHMHKFAANCLILNLKDCIELQISAVSRHQHRSQDVPPVSWLHHALHNPTFCNICCLCHVVALCHVALLHINQHHVKKQKKSQAPCLISPCPAVNNAPATLGVQKSAKAHCTKA